MTRKKQKKKQKKNTILSPSESFLLYQPQPEVEWQNQASVHNLDGWTDQWITLQPVICWKTWPRFKNTMITL